MSPGTKSPDEVFFFVNKGPQSFHLSRSEQREKFLIHSHVQGRWRRDKAQTKEIGELDSQTDAHSSSKPPITEKGADGQSNIAERSSTSDRKILTLSISAKSVKGIARVEYRVAKQRPWTMPRVETAPSPGAALDPFEAFPIRVDAQMHRLLQYYQFSFHCKMWCIHAQAGRRARCCIPIGDFLQDCFNNSATIFSTLACMAIRMREASASMHFMQRAVAELRQILNRAEWEATANSLIWAICLLWFVEMSRPDISAGAMHIKGAKALVAQMPSSVSDQLKTLVHKLDIRTTWMMILKSGSNLLPETPRRSLNSSDSTRSTNNVLLSGRYRNILDDNLVAVIQDLDDFVHLFEQAFVAGTEPNADLFEDFYSWNKEVDGRLVFAPTTSPQAEVFQLTIKIWKRYNFSQGRHAFPALPFAKDLAELLEQHPMSIWLDHLDGLMWVHTVGAMAAAHINAAWSESGPLSVSVDDVEQYFVRGIARILQRKGVCALPTRREDFLTAEGLRNFSRQFFYLDAIQSRLLHLLSAKVRRKVAELEMNPAGC